MNKKLALIIFPVCLSIILLGGGLPHFKHRHHSKPQPIIKAIEESASEDSKISVDEVGPSRSRFELALEKTLPPFEAEKSDYTRFKSVNIVARPPPAFFC